MFQWNMHIWIWKAEGWVLSQLAQKSRGRVFRGFRGFPRPGGLLARGQDIRSLESLRDLTDVPVEHVHRNMENGSRGAGLAGQDRGWFTMRSRALPSSGDLLPWSGSPFSLEYDRRLPDVLLEHVRLAIVVSQSSCLQVMIQKAAGGKLIGPGPDVQVEHVHRNLEIGG